MKFDRLTSKIAVRTRMGSADAPPQVVKHISKSGPSDTASPHGGGRRPMVCMGNGEMPVLILKHLK